jgi:hypothetical protein
MYLKRGLDDKHRAGPGGLFSFALSFSFCT